MKALTFPALNSAEITAVSDPTLDEDGVVIEVESAGICHTDLEIMRGNYPAEFPVVPGHEFAGRILEVGKDVHDLHPGMRVAVDPLVTCKTCSNCQRGRFNLCRQVRAYGAELDGGLAQFAAVKASNVYPVGDLESTVAALSEPFACALHGIDRVAPHRDDRAIIFGAGPIGLLLSVALAARGVQNIDVVDVFSERLQTAQKFGASHTHLASDSDALNDRSYDVVIDATGRPPVVQNALRLLDDGGTLLNFGVCPPESQVVLDPYDVYFRELRILGSFSLSGNISDAVDALSATSLPVSDLVTHSLDLDHATKALGLLGQQDTLKVQINPRSPNHR